MYISLIEATVGQTPQDYPIMINELSGNTTESFSMEAGAKWLRDNTQELYIPESVGKYTVIIEGDGIAAPNIKPVFIGKLFSIQCKTRFIEYCHIESNSGISRDYQPGTLAFHTTYEQESTKPIRTYDLVDSITSDGLYSYRPILKVRLQSVEITRDEKNTRWKLKFIEQ